MLAYPVPVRSVETVRENKPLVKVARPEPRQSVELGFLTGVNFSYADGDPPKQGNTLNAFSVAATVDIPLSRNFSLCPELGWVQRGVRTQLASLFGIDIAGDVRLQYLELPILLKAKWNTNRKLRGFAYAGPNFGLALSRQVEVMGLVEVDLSNRFAGYDLGTIIGGGIEYAVDKDTWFVFTTRYTLGLIDIDMTEDSYKTRGLQLLLGLRFGL